jgi:hypothetical protein
MIMTCVQPLQECKTVITTELEVMRGMDPHMISGTWDRFLVKSWVGLCQSGFTRLLVGHSETPRSDRGCYL